MSLACACIDGHTLAMGTPYMQVFCVTGMAAFLAYGFYTVPHGIWWGQPWGAVAIAAARQATPRAAATGRTNSRMEVSQGLERFQLGQERPEDSQATLKRIWRQIMAERSHGARTQNTEYAASP